MALASIVLKASDPVLLGVANDIVERDGDLTPRALVDDAAAPTHPLHRRFVWDNDVAGDEYRLLQARWMIATITIVPAPLAAPVRVFINVPAGPGRRQAYHPITAIRADPAKAAAVVDRYTADLASLQARYESYELVIQSSRASRAWRAITDLLR